MLMETKSNLLNILLLILMNDKDFFFFQFIGSENCMGQT